MIPLCTDANIASTIRRLAELHERANREEIVALLQEVVADSQQGNFQYRDEFVQHQGEFYWVRNFTTHLCRTYHVPYDTSKEAKHL
jgi:hypothetical protein